MRRVFRPAVTLSALLLTCASAQAQFARVRVPLPSAPVVLPDPFAGVAVEDADEAFAFHVGGRVSSGPAYNLATEMAPRPYSAAYDSMRAAAMDASGQVHAWYSPSFGLRYSRGTPTYLHTDRRGVSIGRRSILELVDVGIRKPDGLFFAFWRDRTVTITDDPSNLTKWGTYSFSTPVDTGRIAGMDFLDATRVRTWLTDGTYIDGTWWDLGQLTGSERARFVAHEVLKAPPQRGALPPYTTISRPAATAQTWIDDMGKDATLAVGDRYVGIAGDAGVRFFDQDGSPLSGGALNAAGGLDLGALFAPFVRAGPTSTLGPVDLNNYLGIGGSAPRDCEQQPTLVPQTWRRESDDGSVDILTITQSHLALYAGIETRDFGLCIARSGAYDTRMLYDRAGQRFIIVGQLRNPVWTRHFGRVPLQNYSPNIWSPTGQVLNTYVRMDTDRLFTQADPSNAWFFGDDVGQHARRTMVFAISRTSDPRDGFHAYAYARNIYKDWPFAQVNGDWLLLGHRDPSDLGHFHGTVSTMVSLSDLRAGREQPQYVRYQPQDIVYANGQAAKYVEPAHQYGSFADRSLLVSGDRPHYTVVSLPHPITPYAKRPARVLERPAMLIGDNVHVLEAFEPERSVFRHDTLITVSHWYNTTLGAWGLKTYRLQLQPTPNGGVSVFSESLTTDLHVSRHDLEAMPQINSIGNVAILFGRDSKTGGSSTIQARISPNTALTASVDRTLVTGWSLYDFEDIATRVNALNVSTDPTNPLRFWYIHPTRNGNGAWRTVFGSYLP